MGSDRRATREMREEGRMCSNCVRTMDMGFWKGGPRLCDRCLSSRQVLLRFRYDQCFWYCDFLDPKSKIPVGRQRRFETADTIRSMVAKTHTALGGTKKVMFERSLSIGAGELLLDITGEQFIKLK